MRGITGVMLAIILMLIAALIASYFIGTAAAKGKEVYAVGTEAQKIVGNPSEVINQETIIPTQQDSTPPKHIYTALTDSQPFRPSEIACFISNSIYKDFTTRGVSAYSDWPSQDCFPGSDAISYATSSEIYHFCLLDNEDSSKVFEMGAVTSDENSQSWQADLTARDCKLCQEGGTVVPNLDEVCINMDLQRDVPLGHFCKGSFFTQSSSTGAAVAFSNCDCGNRDSGAAAKHGNNAAWNAHCNGYYDTGLFGSGFLSQGYVNCANSGNEFCDNQRGESSSSYDYAQNMINWQAETGTDPYTVSDSILWGHRDMGEEYSFDKLDISPSKYVYGVFWMPEEKRYYTLFEKVPASKPESDFNFLIDGIKSINDNYQRYNPLGYSSFKPEARRVIDRVVTAPATESYNDFLSNTISPIATNLGFDLGEDNCHITQDGSVKYKKDCILTDTSCSGEECINGNIVPIDSGWYQSYLLGNDLGPANGKGDAKDIYLAALKDYDIKISIDSQIYANGLVAGNKYRVVVNNWVGIYGSQGAGATDAPYYTYSVDKSIGIYPAEESSSSPTNPTDLPPKWTLHGGTIGIICIGSNCAAAGKSTTVTLTKGSTATVVVSPTVTSGGIPDPAFVGPIQAHCGNGQQDSLETGVDCGSTGCAPCVSADKVACIDVISGVMTGEICSPSKGTFSQSFDVSGDATLLAKFS